MFESGNLNLDPSSIGSVMAMSAGNSIFTLSAFLQDSSSSRSLEGEVTRILGNLNRPGIVVLVPPLAPLIRKCNPATWQVIAHKPFDDKPNDAFAHTSLHLSFTQYEMPLIVRTGAVDAEVTVIESLVSVYDRQNWTGDIDVVSHSWALNCDEKARCDPNWGGKGMSYNPYYYRSSDCRHPPSGRTLPSESFIKRLAMIYRRQLISIDSWDELLDPPDRLGSYNIGVFRAVGNWQVKLAAFTICMQLGYLTLLKHADSCVECLIDNPLMSRTEIYIL